MEIRTLKPRKALNKAFLKVKPNRTEIESFKTNLIQLLDRIEDNESEEFHKNLVIDFLKKTYYDPNHFVNTKGRNDLVIHNTNSASGAVGVIVEAKKPSNKAEMMKMFAPNDTPEQKLSKINVKAFQELVLYYLRERITQKNIEVKYLIATNINEWFIFDATQFDRLFAQNKNLVKQFNDFEGGRLADIKTDFFYKQIAEPFINQINHDIEFTYFDIRDYEKPLRNDDRKDDNKLISLFKLLSPEHLLKLPFSNDSNSLDKRFYGELLHIIGLTETKEGSKKLIDRNAVGERNTGSFLENAIIQLDSLDKISRLENPTQFGANIQERLFSVGLELSITWINRILFLKLLEAQLITYHKGDKSYEFLSFDKIKDYDDLNRLFFQVLARKQSERNEDIKAIFAKVPYLNSSLFEPTEIEHTTLFISNLNNVVTIPIYTSTVIKDGKGKKRTGNINPLEYLFEFLNAYDFASEGSEEIQEDNKTLINASVLGLIFEKINGYKDGSFFTPGFITMYMCRETIRKAVVQKFNDAKKWNCADLKSVYDKIEDRTEANNIINDLKICDPAVGSGHFLVSALNEIIAIKNDIKILQDREGKRLKEYHFEVVNDELIVTDEDGKLFEYNPTNKESQRIQETLFHEKQTIIENCLFGVDINQNSVKICRLRLWIELLKNAYYKNATELETLPNIDINIKCGNSLISRFALDADLKQALKNSASKWTIDSYRLAVDTYRNAKSKEQKHEMERLISEIKTNFRSEISLNDPKAKRLRNLNGELFSLTNQGQLFELSKREKTKWNAKVAKLTTETQKLDAEIKEIKANKIYENAFEWRFEFPEVLDENGDYVGFDLVIGNPPYITILLGKKQTYSINESNYYKTEYKTFEYKGNTYVLFIELANKISKINGCFNYIIPNTLLLSNTYSYTRKYLLDNQSIIQLLNCEFKVFEEAEIGGTLIILSQKKVDIENEISTISFSNYFYDTLIFQKTSQNKYHKTNLNKFYLDNNTIDILDKSFVNSKKYGDIVKIYQGIITGDNKRFISNEKLNDKYVKIIRGKDVNRYNINFSSNYLLFDKELLWSNTDENNFLTEKIISRQTSDSLIASIDSENYFSLDSTHVHTILDKNYNLYFLLALFNSKFLNYIYQLIVQEEGRVFAQVKAVILKELPIKYCSLLDQAPFIDLVNEIIRIKNQTPNTDTAELERQSDQMVYKLYDITAEEIAIIEK